MIFRECTLTAVRELVRTGTGLLGERKRSRAVGKGVCLVLWMAERQGSSQYSQSSPIRLLLEETLEETLVQRKCPEQGSEGHSCPGASTHQPCDHGQGMTPCFFIFNIEPTAPATAQSCETPTFNTSDSVRGT